MNYVIVEQYPNLEFDERIINLWSNMKFSERATLKLLDVLDRLNRYGLDSMMIGGYLKENSSEETSTLHIPCDDFMLELIAKSNEKNSIHYIELLVD
ncbi:hypothetical protein QEZ44_14590 [Bacillus cereus]|uniref:hypothetical protein n=1 Tax=Bacillus cereus TaxID=1396 RepID=UPI000BF50844|nr:hypothetical protein [Bacillus cereus]MDH4422637.1 hypothetical protein [Bacillus cereus]PER25005.1 hypothetical protein CN476_13210 [Bacillus cereus]